MPDLVTDETLFMMSTYGGSFANQLAKLYRLADPDNRLILEQAFGDLFQKYTEMAALRVVRTVS